jgi:hypothetical protein
MALGISHGTNIGGGQQAVVVGTSRCEVPKTPAWQELVPRSQAAPIRKPWSWGPGKPRNVPLTPEAARSKERARAGGARGADLRPNTY